MSEIWHVWRPTGFLIDVEERPWIHVGMQDGSRHQVVRTLHMNGFKAAARDRNLSLGGEKKGKTALSVSASARGVFRKLDTKRNAWLRLLKHTNISPSRLRSLGL